MSGIEIVGVVLGALPLVVSAYKHRKHAKGAASAFTHFDTKYSDFAANVEHVQILLELSLSRLLSPLVDARLASQQEVDEFIQDPDPSLESNQVIVSALADNPDKCNARCFTLMGEIHQAVLTLMEEVNFYEADVQAHLSGNENTNITSKASKAYLKSAWSYRNAQLRFSLKTKNRESILNSIRVKQQHISELAQFSNTSLRIGTGSARVGTGRARQFLLTYARHVTRIYRLTQERWGCQCMDNHLACVWLKHPAPRTSNFDFFVMPSKDLREFHAWEPQGLDIHWKLGSESSCSSKDAAPGKGKAPQSNASNMPLRTWDTSGVMQASTQALDPATHQGRRTTASINEIDALCNVIALSAVSSSHLGIFTDSKEPCQYDIHSSPCQNQPTRSITLLSALQPQHPQRLWRDRTTRFQLALAIASAHLQLVSADWISSHWSIRDVLFPQHTSVEDGSADLQMPFVQGDFRDQPVEVGRRTDRAFTSLGIILMELLFGEMLDDHPLWQRDGWSPMRSDAYVRMLVAKQWLDDVLPEGGPLYFAAVQWCLTESPSKLEGEQWRKDLTDRVILPLERSCEWIKTDAI